jgi:hypothetical protein
MNGSISFSSIRPRGLYTEDFNISSLYIKLENYEGKLRHFVESLFL